MSSEAPSRTGRRLAVLAVLLLAGGAGAWAWREGYLAALTSPSPAKAQAPAERRVPVLVAQAVAKPMPLRVEALGIVEPMITVPIRSRVASTVLAVGFADGASVKKGDTLYTLDSREIDAQIRQAEATLQKDKSQLEKNKRDVERYTGLAQRAAISQVQVEDAITLADVQKATVQQGEANLQALRAQRTYYDIAAPASGRMGVSSVRAGAVIRVDDTLSTLRQLKPIYVAFGIPERYLSEVRAAAEKAKVDISLQGSGETVTGGKVAVIDNTLDPQTGTLIVRAAFDNADERLWPGTLGSVTVTLRMESGVVAVPAEAVQSGQNGPYVFIVDNGAAKVVQVTVARTVDGEAVVTAGLKGGETVVTDGQLSLRNGTKVDVRRAAPPVAGS